MSFNPATHRLEGSSGEHGGLIVKNKQGNISGSDDDVFKKPSTSLLGLDRLAKRKKEEREAELGFSEKKPRIHGSAELSDIRNSDSSIRVSFGKSSKLTDAGAKERKYRSTQEETPSHTGGVSAEALQRIHSRLAGKEQKGHGVYATTSRSGRYDRPRDRVPRSVVAQRMKCVWW